MKKTKNPDNLIDYYLGTELPELPESLTEVETPPYFYAVTVAYSPGASNAIKGGRFVIMANNLQEANDAFMEMAKEGKWVILDPPDIRRLRKMKA